MVSTTPLDSVCRCSRVTCITSTLGRACTSELATRLMNSSFVTLVSARRPRTAQKFVSSCRGQYLGAMPVRHRPRQPLATDQKANRLLRRQLGNRLQLLAQCIKVG